MGMLRNTLKDLWQNIKKWVREVEKEDSGTLEDKNIILEIDRETLLQEYIPKDQYETRLKADLKAILVELQLEIEEMSGLCTEIHGDEWNEINIVHSQDVLRLIQEKINELRGNEELW